ncbi:MAG TPA: DUF5906 domain-containing protein, partial [Burkholderiales bacterium]|nr:DUF5906 domain-containing protein [Burkholderiales bacterium]
MSAVGEAAFREALANLPGIDASDPREAAKAIVREYYACLAGDVGAWRLVHWRQEFYIHRGTRWMQYSLDDLREVVWKQCHFAGKPVRKRHVDDVVDALRAECHRSDTIEPPCWLHKADGLPDPRKIVPMENGLLVLPSRELLEHTPRFFSLQSLPFPFLPAAPAAAHWFQFLSDVWGEDDDSIRLWQWWCGYCLLHRTEQQKILLLIGPIRSGKGTMIRLLQALLGKENTASPTLGSLAQPFGLASLVGKLLAVVSDVRLSGRVDIATVVENLLRVSGEDAVTIQRKYLPDLTTTLTSRLMLVSNELPWFADT